MSIRWQFVRMSVADQLVTVKEHAVANYEKGWDVVVECMSDAEILEVIKGARSKNGAIQRMCAHIAPRVERQKEHDAEARSSM